MAEPAGEPLAPYRAKRDFTRTAEPAGAATAGATTGATAAAADPAAAPRRPRWVVQRHRARRLHYDLRFEIDGVLVSWAVPKGPTLDPSVRRAAFHVEDHPLEYIDFEGVIPAGEYGGGDVIVWDEGTWEHHVAGGPADPGAAVRAGELHVDVTGHKLAGRFVLVRTGVDRSGKETWLLLHKHDGVAVDGWDPEDHPRSVRSGRTNDEVAADPDRAWRSGAPAAVAAVDLRPAPTRSHAPTGPPTPVPTAEELAALDDLGPGGGTWRVHGRDLRVTNLDKELWPGRPGEAPVTKRELLRYTAAVAGVALPHLRGRALNMHRFPGGAATAGFWHKQLPDHAPDWLARWLDPDGAEGEGRCYLVVDEPAALVWAANFGALEWHAWTSRTDAPEQPTYALVDLDPGPSTSWDELLVLGRLHRTALEHLGVLGRPKVTGQRGIQIWIPIATGPSFADTRAWTEQLSQAVGRVVPQLVSWEWRVADRRGLARLDYTQNARNKTLVAPYSPRPAPGAPVSAPIDWEELDDPELRPDRWTIRSLPARLAARGDLFAPLLDHPQVLPPWG